MDNLEQKLERSAKEDRRQSDKRSPQIPRCQPAESQRHELSLADLAVLALVAGAVLGVVVEVVVHSVTVP